MGSHALPLGAVVRLAPTTKGPDDFACCVASTFEFNGLVGGFTNKAKRPTNRLIAPSAPETVATPPVPASGQEVANRNLGPVQVQILTAGKVLEWAQTDLKGQTCALRSGLTPGQTFILNPGDKVRFAYEEAPSWSWKGF